jgi:hypothetical protein
LEYWFSTIEDEELIKKWTLLKEKHIKEVYRWAKEKGKENMVLKIENDVIKTLTEDGAELDVKFILNGVEQ